MASRRPFSYPRYQAWGSDETFLNGGTIEFFDAGTTNNRNIYQDADLTTTAPNPVTLNSRGEPQSAGGTAIDLYLDNQAYKIVLKDSAGVTVHTIDDYIETQDVLEPKDPADATDQATDVFEGSLNSDPASNEVFQVDFQTANTTTTPTFENTSGSLGALTIKTRDGGELWAGALQTVHWLYYDGTDYRVLDPDAEQGSSPEHATDSGTDTYVSATNTGTPGDGNTISRDFQSANTTTTPTLDGKTMTTRDGSALWSGAVSGVHDVQYDSGADTYLVLDPIPDIPVSTDLLDEDDMASDSDTAVPTQQSVKAYALTGPATSSDPSLAFDTWRNPNANRPTLVIVRVFTTTDGMTTGVIDAQVDESGGTTSDYQYRTISDLDGGSGFSNDAVFTFIVPAGGSYQIANTTDPNSVNGIGTHRELTL